MNRETGGAILAFGGFVFLVGAFKGTWRNALHGLAPDVFGAAGGSSNGGDFGTLSGTGAKSAPAGSRLPGTSVRPGGGLSPLAGADARR